MKTTLSPQQLQTENRRYRGRGGVSEENRGEGFRPAFLDTQTQRVYPSCFVDGRPAPCHLLDGLPDEVVLERSACGRVVSVKTTIISGFVRGDRFYDREQAAAEVARLH